MKLLLCPVASLLLVLVASCGDVEVRLPPSASFDLQGRLAVRNATEGFSGTVRWKSDARADTIWLSTPLGQSFAQLEANPDSATLTTADAKQYRARSIERLTQSAWGWRFPAEPLHYWVRATPAPGLPYSEIEKDALGRLTHLIQSGWQVTFDYGQKNTRVPFRIRLFSDDVEILLVIDRFESRSP